MVIIADIATTVDSFHRITTTTAVAIDVFDGQCSEGAPLTISTAATASDMVNSERLLDVMQSVTAAGPATCQ